MPNCEEKVLPQEKAILRGIEVRSKNFKMKIQLINDPKFPFRNHALVIAKTLHDDIGTGLY